MAILTWSVVGCAPQTSKGTIARPRSSSNGGAAIRAETKAGAQRLPKPSSAAKRAESARNTTLAGERAESQPVPTIGESNATNGDASPTGTNSEWVSVLTYEKNAPAPPSTPGSRPETSSSMAVLRGRQAPFAIAMLAVVAAGLVLWIASRHRVRG